MRAGADAGQLDDTQSLQWSSHFATPSDQSTWLTADKAYLYNQVEPAAGLLLARRKAEQ